MEDFKDALLRHVHREVEERYGSVAATSIFHEATHSVIQQAKTKAGIAQNLEMNEDLMKELGVKE